MNQDFTIPERGSPLAYFLDPGGSNRLVITPPLGEFNDGRFLAIGHVGSANTLTVKDSEGVTLTTLAVDEACFLFASALEWIVMRLNSIQTSPEDPDTGVGVIETLTGATNSLSDNAAGGKVIRAAPATTSINLPSVTVRGGALLRLYDMSTSIGGGGHTITVNPDGAETIQGESSFEMFSSGSGIGLWANVVLYPSEADSMWYVH